MPNLILFDEPKVRVQLLPFSFTRPIAEIRMGILTIREKWEYHFNTTASYFTEEYLRAKYPLKIDSDNLILNASYLPEEKIIAAIKKLNPNEALVNDEEIIAIRCDEKKAESFFDHFLAGAFKNINYVGDADTVKNVWSVFLQNGKQIERDFDVITKARSSQPLNATNTLLGSGRIFIEEGAVVNASIFNTTGGSIYIGKDAEVMEGCTVRGPFALCEHSALKMAAKIYGDTTIGPHSKVGGEVSNSVIFGYSNKAHDGFLGNSVIGEWCNLGADTNNSNLKNNYANVKLWNYAEESFADTGLQFCGLFMGDHSKCGINTMFNTGTVVGVSANVFGTGFPRNFIPSFSWGGAQGMITYKKEQAFETAKLVMQRRNILFSAADEKILEEAFYHDEKYRKP